MPSPFGTSILPALDAIRGIGGALGLRPFVVTVRVRTWTGGTRPGLGQKTDVDTVLTNMSGANAQPIMVRYVTNREVIASGGKYRDRDLKVGPITPNYVATGPLAAGGFTSQQIDPPPVISAQEIQYLVQAPDFPASINSAGGMIFDKIAEERTQLHFYLVLRNSGRQP